MLTKEKLNAFLAKVEGNTAIEEELAATNSLEEYVDRMNREGFDFTLGDIKTIAQVLMDGMAAAGEELSEDELAAVAGGASEIEEAPYIQTMRHFGLDGVRMMTWKDGKVVDLIPLDYTKVRRPGVHF